MRVDLQRELLLLLFRGPRCSLFETLFVTVHGLSLRLHLSQPFAGAALRRNSGRLSRARLSQALNVLLFALASATLELQTALQIRRTRDTTAKAGRFLLECARVALLLFNELTLPLFASPRSPTHRLYFLTQLATALAQALLAQLLERLEWVAGPHSQTLP
jgi:hypothetical protein